MNRHHNILILCILDDDYGRDVELLLPLVYFAEKYLPCRVSFAFIWDIHAIYRVKPHLLLLANTVGSNLHFEASKYAAENGIRVFALVSEGNFRTDGSFDYWGYNYDKTFYQEFICLWSERTRTFLRNELPAIKDKMVLTGATGFDRYSIYEFMSRDDFLHKMNRPGFKKIIGYAGWAFGKMYNKQGREELKYLHQFDQKKIQWIEDQMHAVEHILKEAIENNPDILFLLKRHPNEANPSIIGECMNEMVRLKTYQNVIYLTENVNIHDLISVADFWVAFESTTTLEAWLMNRKQTILINPDPDFQRDELYNGSVIVKSSAEFQQVIDEFYLSGKISLFFSPEKQAIRNQLIKDTIGFSDGLNHLRTGFYLKKIVETIDPASKIRVNLSWKFLLKYILMEIGKYFFIENIFRRLPKFKKTIWIFKRYRLRGIPEMQKEYHTYLDRFYLANKLGSRIQTQEIWKDIIA